MDSSGVTWDFDVDGQNLYHCLNGKRTVSEKGENVVEEIGHGRTSAEIWMKFKGAKSGKNLLIRNYFPSSNFSQKNPLLHGTTVGNLIDNISKYCPWVRLKTRTKRPATCSESHQTKTKVKKISIGPEYLDFTSCDQDPMKDIKFKENFIGKFEINILTLSKPPDRFLARRINNSWVDILKKKIVFEPTLVTTVFPVLVDPSQVNETNPFCEQKLSTYNLWTLGGNHLRTAMQDINKNMPLLDIRNVHIHLYKSLSEEEAISLGNLHNGSNQYLKPTFQDCIEQGSRYRTELTSEITSKVQTMLCDIERREVPKESIGNIVSVLKYNDTNFELVKRIFQKFEQQHGTLKSIPQSLFRELQGIKEEERNKFLSLALNKSLDIAIKETKKSKKRAKLESCFLKVLNVDRELASELYPEHFSQIDKYTDLDMPKDSIPEIFIQFCQDAKMEKENLSNFQTDIKVKISYNGRNIEQSKLIINHVNKMKAKLNQFIINHEIQILKEITVVESEVSMNATEVESEDSMIVVRDDSGVNLDVTQNVSEDSVLDESEMIDSEDRETQPPYSQIDLFR